MAVSHCLSYCPVGRGKCGNCGRTISKHTKAELAQPWGKIIGQRSRTEHDPRTCNQCAEEAGL